MKRVMFRLASQVITLGLVLVTLEVGLRLREPSIRVNRPHDPFLFEDSHGCVLINGPRTRTIAVPNFPPHEMSINTRGLRGPEIRESPRTRVIFVGDSITLNHAIPEQESFNRRIEAALREEGCDVEARSFGTSDSGIVQYRRKVEPHRLALEPSGRPSAPTIQPQGLSVQKGFLQRRRSANDWRPAVPPGSPGGPREGEDSALPSKDRIAGRPGE